MTGVPVGGSTVTVSAATYTPTPILKPVLRGPFPNPVDKGPVVVDVEVPVNSSVKWSVFTLSFRKIVDGEISVNGKGSVQWDLRDKTGALVADGLYYLRLEVLGTQPSSKIFKVLILR